MGHAGTNAESLGCNAAVTLLNMSCPNPIMLLICAALHCVYGSHVLDQTSACNWSESKSIFSEFFKNYRASNFIADFFKQGKHTLKDAFAKKVCNEMRHLL